MKPTHIDLTVRDFDRLREFFLRVFGRQTERFAIPLDACRIQARPQAGPGIDADIARVSDGPVAGGDPPARIVIPVPDLEAVMARVKASGGQIIEPKARIPGIGWCATCAEPGGLRFGVIELDPAAGQRRSRGTGGQTAAVEKVAPGSSIGHAERSILLPVAGLCALAVFTSLYWLFAALRGVQASNQSGFIWLIGFSLLVTWVVEADRTRRGYGAPFEFSAFVFFAWPLLLPWYLFSTRGRRGLVWAAAAFLLFLGPFLISLIAFTVLGAMN
jgi:predicted enzyme related to lactoylglutathione lyase